MQVQERKDVRCGVLLTCGLFLPSHQEQTQDCNTRVFNAGATSFALGTIVGTVRSNWGVRTWLAALNLLASFDGMDTHV